MKQNLISQSSSEIIIDDARSKADQVINSLDISENSRREYKYRIRLFLKFVRNQSWNRDTFREFKRYLENRNDLAVSSKSKYLAVARVFLKELARLGVLPVDLTINTKDFKKSRKHTKQGLTNGEVLKLSDYLNSLPDTKESLRLKAMYFLFIHQGLRAIEVSRLNVEDINLGAGTILIQGKGLDGKELTYIEPTTAKAINHYMQTAKAKSGSLFFSFGNRSRERLTTNHIQRLFRNVFRKLEINKSLHGTRHFFVTYLLNNGLDMRDVKKFSRHANMDTVTIYDDEQDIKAKTEQVFKIFQSLYAV